MVANLYLLKHTLLIYAFIFVLAIIITIIFHKTDWGRDMLKAIVSWLIIFIVFLITAYSGKTAFSCLIFLIALLAVREYYILNGVWNFPFIVVSVIFLLATLYAIIFQRFKLFYLIPGISVLLFFPCLLFRTPLELINKKVGIGVFGLIYWGWLPFHFSLLHRLEHGFGYIILLCTMFALNDNTAYYVGKLLGKKGKKLAPKISPGKTWIGETGGFLMTFLVVLAFRYTVLHFSYVRLFFTALIVGLLIPVGDLIESAMKRDIGVKDSGSIIPGHGGIMDRFDSWVFTAPIIYYYILLTSN